MGIGAASHGRCPLCGSEHHGLVSCPREPPATGAERPGWRVQVETPSGYEAIGVLLAPSQDRWRARIVTYPNVLWSAPGGRGTLKFFGDTLEEAEAQAIRFVEDHVRAKRYLRRGGKASVGGSATVATRVSPPRPPFVGALSRKSRCLPLRFGPNRAVVRGVTLNLSADGMFVGVATPEEGGQSLLIHLNLEGQMLPLRGLVMWNRRRGEPERPVGMGIRLAEPPAYYRSFVASLP